MPIISQTLLSISFGLTWELNIIVQLLYFTNEESET